MVIMNGEVTREGGVLLSTGDDDDPLRMTNDLRAPARVTDTPPPYESIVLSHEHPSDGSGGIDGMDPQLQEVTDEPRNFEVKVIDPVKQGDGVNAYISYKVVSTLNDGNLGRREVIRRFRDFTWLRNCLRKKFSGIIVPPLPPRSVVEKYKMTPDFVEDRRRALERFLYNVLSHPVLSSSSELKLFLQASESEFAIESSRVSAELGSAAPAESGGASGLASKTLHTASKFFKSLTDTAGLALASSHGAVGSMNVQQHIKTEETPEYIAIRTYFNHLEAHLNEVHQQAQRLTRQHERLGKSMSEFGESLEMLSSKMKPLHDVTSGDAGEYSSVLGKKANTAGQEWSHSAGNLHMKFEAPLRELLRSIQSAKKTIEDRDESLVAKVQAQMHVDSKKGSLAKLQVTPGTRQDRIMEAERHVQQAVHHSEEATKKYQDLVERMDADIDRFQRDRTRDLKQLLVQFCQVEQDAHQATYNAWSQQ